MPINPYYAAAFEYKSPVDFLHSLAEQYGKPVLMTEVGYRSIHGTAIAPGSWTTIGTPDSAAQADAYNAFFQVWSAQGGSWFKGVELWQWDLNNQYSPTGYSVMGKPAEAVVSQYFHGQGFSATTGAVSLAYNGVTGQPISLPLAESVTTSINAGQYTLAQYIDGLIANSQSTTIPALVPSGMRLEFGLARSPGNMKV